MSSHNIQARFGSAIRDRRIELAWSQDDLAGQCGLKRTYLSDVERGERNVSLVNVFRLAKALGVGVTDLMGRCEKRPLNVGCQG
jgi:transcriptional regulator with XRE-family HTH domain